MPFTLIKGTFHAVGLSPDGDSVKFKADNINNWKKIQGHPKLSKKKNQVQLRFEGIDAPETHFRPSIKGASNTHQPDKWAHGARDFMLDSVGIKNVVWGPKNSKVVMADDGVKGYILTRAVDNNRYGRPVSFVFAGNPPEQDGAKIHFDAKWLKKSVNYKLVEAGYAYPTYYQTLFYDLRNEFTQAVIKARSANPKKGLWKDDKTGGLNFTGVETIIDDYPIFPKLFRRMIEHFQGGGKLSDFEQFLKDKKDGVLILPQAHHTDALDYLIEIKGKRVTLKVLPENLIFDPQG
jgi:endonuclease YncB( thermonuclease family)